MTLHQTLEKQRLERGVIDPRLFPPTLPVGGEHIWDWFWQLDNGREDSFNGLAKISHGQIAAWSSLARTELRNHEVQIILAMDRARLKASSPEAIEARKLANKPPLTAEKFSALFGDLKRMAEANKRRKGRTG